ncbi:hypothetical protein A1O3_00841 [Capronia epimyces CBS 606.96]|uniref:Fungal lipase-like domain-containing protein n=1 Tax=Capronia epimyces CBS 606.96 TaxID=1182542 RepID=W9YSP8_9EURO|nr:uncharacterized protein A1O3_00841 [Capronia epimyces CBS 606.96]EXJ92291.1 hypothetical protein A1O3_00841 [Capronia epimyces CBS 606.96]
MISGINILAYILLCTTLAHAVPLQLNERRDLAHVIPLRLDKRGGLPAFPIRLNKRAISQDLLDTFSLYEQYSAAAYCADNNVPSSNGTAITCVAGNCPQVQADGAESVIEFQNIGSGDATGFVALDHTTQQIIISFRGSQSLQNFVADAEFPLSPSTICTGCEVHTGFLDSWTSVKSLVQGAVETARTTYPSYGVVSTGHSLGAALATLAAADLRNGGYGVSLYTYGSPMVGNIALATFITAQDANFRITHANDLVPKLPGYGLGYAHVSPEYWITSATGVVVTVDDVQTSEGVVDVQGNEGQPGGDLGDHLFYFNEVAACGPDVLGLEGLVWGGEVEAVQLKL